MIVLAAISDSRKIVTSAIAAGGKWSGKKAATLAEKKLWFMLCWANEQPPGSSRSRIIKILPFQHLTARSWLIADVFRLLSENCRRVAEEEEEEKRAQAVAEETRKSRKDSMSHSLSVAGTMKSESAPGAAVLPVQQVTRGVLVEEIS
jgi:hypothetical protein